MSEIRVTNIIGETGLDAVNFSKGINISSGVCTATSFSGSVAATNLTGTIADARFPATLPAISGANLTGISAGIEMAQQWRLTSSSNGNQTPLTAWEAIDTGGQGNIGSAMSVSSGIFTYPTTGIYLILFTLSGYSDNHTQNVIGTISHTLNNGGGWITCGSGFDGIYDFNNSYPSWGDTFTMHMVDITDLSNQKTRFTYGAGQGGEYVHGNSNYSYTTATFIRLAAT